MSGRSEKNASRMAGRREKHILRKTYPFTAPAMKLSWIRLERKT